MFQMVDPTGWLVKYVADDEPAWFPLAGWKLDQDYLCPVAFIEGEMVVAEWDSASDARYKYDPNTWHELRETEGFAE